MPTGKEATAHDCFQIVYRVVQEGTGAKVETKYTIITLKILFFDWSDTLNFLTFRPYHIMDQNREVWGDNFSLHLFPEHIACVKNGDPAQLADIQKTQWESHFDYYNMNLAVEDNMLGVLLSYLCGFLTMAATPDGLPLERSAAISGHFLAKIPEMTDIETFLRCTDEMEIYTATAAGRSL